MTVAMRLLVGGELGDGKHALILKEADGDRYACLTVPFFGLIAVISAKQELTDASLPSGHVGWAQTIRNSGVTLEHFLIHTIGDDGTPLSLLQFKQGERVWTEACSLSDGIAVTLRIGAPILFEESVLIVLSADIIANEEGVSSITEEKLRLFYASHPDSEIPKA